MIPVSRFLTHDVEHKGKGGWSVKTIRLSSVGASMAVGEANGLIRIVTIA